MYLYKHWNGKVAGHFNEIFATGILTTSVMNFNEIWFKSQIFSCIKNAYDNDAINDEWPHLFV